MAPAEVLAVRSYVMETLVRDFEIQLGQRRDGRRLVAGVGEGGMGRQRG